VKLVGAVLAGGKSSRMGRDKAGIAIPERDVTLGARALDLLRATCDDVVVLGHGRAMPSDVTRIEDALDDVGPLGGLLALLRSGRGDAYLVLAVDMPGVEAHHVRALVRLLPRSLSPAGAPLRSSTSASVDVAQRADSKPASVDEHGGAAIAQSEAELEGRRARAREVTASSVRDTAGSVRAACLAVDGVIEPLPIAIADVEFAREVVERLLASGERSVRAMIEALEPATLAITDRAVIRNVNTLADFDDGTTTKLRQ
jgi:molybdopterin-guanine dinucleotide biosynthesis protein A